MRTSRLNLIVLIAGITGFAVNSNAAPKCGFTLSTSNVNLVWNQNLPTQQISFSVYKSKNRACNYYVTFSKGGASDYDRRMTYSSSSLRYQLYGNASLTNILKELPDVTNNSEIITGSFGKGKNQTRQHTYYLQIPQALATTPTLKPSGVYMDSFVMRVYSGTLGAGIGDGGDDDDDDDEDEDDDDDGPPSGGRLENTVNVQVTTIVPKNVEISLVNSGAGFDPIDTSQYVDFGSLTPGATRNFDIRVATNAGYSISFSSQNNGVLKHASPSIATTVSYTVSVNGASHNLTGSASTPILVATGNGQTQTSGSVNPVTITIGDTSDKMAGNYSDTITVTAATIE